MRPGLARSELLFPSLRQRAGPRQPDLDRKSTRLNSSHLVISYAVFCLKKKRINYIEIIPEAYCRSCITYTNHFNGYVGLTLYDRHPSLTRLEETSFRRMLPFRWMEASR